MTDALLSIRGLRTHFFLDEGTVRAVDGVDLDVRRGRTLGIVGESGCGKSVTAFSILRLVARPGRIVDGDVTLHRDSGRVALTELDEDGPEIRDIRGAEIAMIFQEPMTSLSPVHTVGSQIVEAVRLHTDLRGANARARAVEVLGHVGIPDPATRFRQYPHEMSGGMRQRAMIAMALSCRPSLLIADEPTTALDVTIQAQILELMRDLQAETGMSIMLITHDLGVVRKVADSVCVMKDGDIVEDGPAERIFADPQHDYTRHLLDSEPKQAAAESSYDAPLIRAEGLKVWYPIKAGVMRRTVDHVKAVDGLDITIHAGQTVGVVGESGSGKTTLGLALLRLISSNGDIYFDDRLIQGMKSREMRPLRRRMQVIFQDPFGSLNPRKSVGQIIDEGLRVHGIADSEDARDALIVQALEEVDLDPDSRHRYPHEFSGGQRQRIAVARAMVLKPEFVVLDEPTSSLDVSVQARTLELLQRLQRDHGLAYLFISHDLKVVRAMASYLLVMQEGKVVEEGPAQQVFESPQNPYTQALLAAAFALDAVTDA